MSDEMDDTRPAVRKRHQRQGEHHKPGILKKKRFMRHRSRRHVTIGQACGV